MAWWQNLPVFQIVCPLLCAAVCSVLKGKAARLVMTVLAALECAAMAVLVYFTAGQRTYFVYAMGEIGAPFGNRYWIKSGLSVGEELITAPVSAQQVGQPIHEVSP